MENSYNTSFIPKNSLQVGGETQYVKRRKIYGPGFFLMTIIFAGAVGASLILFFYTSSIERSIAKKIQQIEQTRDGLRKDVLATLMHMDVKSKQARFVLEEHFMTSNVLSLLEDVTLLNVEHESVSYVRPLPEEASPFNDTPAVPTPNVNPPVYEVRGNAKDLKTLALQIERYRTSEYLKEVDLRTVTRDLEESPETSFVVRMQVDPRVLKNASSATVESLPTPEPPAVDAPAATPDSAGSEEGGDSGQAAGTPSTNLPTQEGSGFGSDSIPGIPNEAR